MNRITLMIALSVLTISCKKFLEKKPNISLSIPSTLTDYERLLNHDNMTLSSTAYALGMLAADEYYINDKLYNTLAPDVRATYLWQKDPFQGLPSLDWAKYKVIYTANVVIDGLNSFKVNSPADQQTWNTLLGHALFIRAYTHYSLEEVFGAPYVPATAQTALGIPLKLNPDLSERTGRSTVKQVYDQIIKDLTEAAQLLPAVNNPVNKPSRLTVYAMLSRVYLTMQQYGLSKEFADSALKLKPALYDYNNLSISGTARAFAKFTSPNDFVEVLYPASQQGYSYINGNAIYIDSALFNSYAVNDIRKTAFFVKNASGGNYYFRGQYSGISAFCNGPFTDEMYLNRAECNARLGNIAAALTDMDTLLIKRYVRNTYVPYHPGTKAETLKYILEERKKELVFRGLRWVDLRRLNQEPEFATTIKRIIAGQIHTLLPNSKNYTYPVPIEELQYNPLPQLERE
jgi:hypothetical protein